MGTWRRGSRVFLGVSFPDRRDDAAAIPCGVPIADTFVGLPSACRLAGGDIILRVGGESVQSPNDLVFFWDRAPAGSRVAFDVVRRETHRITISCLAAQRAEVTWENTWPRVAETGATDRLLRDLQQPAYLIPGDLVLSVDGVATGSADQAARLYREHACQAARPTMVVALRRGNIPEPIEGKEATCCWQVVRVPTVRRRRSVCSETDERRDGAALGHSLADMAPRLLVMEGEAESQRQSARPQMDI